MAEEPNKPNVVQHGRAPGAPRQVPNNFSGDYIRTDGSMGNAARDDERHKKEIEEELKRNAALRKQNAEENPPAKQASQELKDATEAAIRNPTSPLVELMNRDNASKLPGYKERVAEHRLFDSAMTVKTLADKNHDGHITADEISSLDKPARDLMFKALNVIEDNSVTVDEINAVKRKLGGLGVTMEVSAEQLSTNLNMGIFGMLLPVGQQPTAPAVANQPNDRGFTQEDIIDFSKMTPEQARSHPKYKQMIDYLDVGRDGVTPEDVYSAFNALNPLGARSNISNMVDMGKKVADNLKPTALPAGVGTTERGH